MRRVPIRMKLAAALLVPLVALVAVTLVEAFTISGDVADTKDEAEMAERLLGPSSLVTMLEHERDAAGVYLLGQERSFSLPVEDNAQARAELDEALETFRSDLRQRSDLAEVYAPAVDALGAIADLRARVDAASDRERTLDNIDAADEVFTGYSDIMQLLFTADRQVARSIEQPDLRRGAELYDLSARQTDAVARLVRDLLLPAVAGEANGLDESGEIATVARVLAEVRANDTQIRLTAQGDYAPLASALYEAEHVVRFPALAESALETGDVDLEQVMAASTGPDPSAEGYTAFRSDVSDMLRQQADDVRSAADARRLRYLGLAVLAVAVAVVIMWIVSRSITGPLRSLTRQAQDMAGRRLPAAVREILDTPLGDDVVVPDVVPVAVRTRDEVADVVAALNTVQESALDLAVEQAVLRRNIADSFVNLGRRNQNLLGRQLDFITELESNETDPEVLGSLFRLDHLATRMRRNAESLLVLAGIEPPRKWAAPVRLTDVIRSALGEVEDYQRVALRSVEPTTVLGSAAADLAHLIAEFVENALTFSPPDVSVEVFGGPRPEGGYRLSITDAGVGMSEADLAEANRRLAGAESFTVAPSKYLGHYVAANLAVRHGVTVSLARRSPGTGIVVTIELPVGLLTDDGEPANVPMPEPRPARAGVGSAGASPLDVHGPDIYAPPASDAPRTPAGLPMRGPRPAQPGAEAPQVTASGLPMRRRGAATPAASDPEDPGTPAGLPTHQPGGPATPDPTAQPEPTAGGLPTRQPGGPATPDPTAQPEPTAGGLPSRQPDAAMPERAAQQPPLTAGGLPIRERGGPASPHPATDGASSPGAPTFPAADAGLVDRRPADEAPLTPGGLPIRRRGAAGRSSEEEATEPDPAHLPRTAGNGLDDPPRTPSPADDATATGWPADGDTTESLPGAPTAPAPAVGWPTQVPPADEHPATAPTGDSAWALALPPVDGEPGAPDGPIAGEALPTSGHDVDAAPTDDADRSAPAHHRELAPTAGAPAVGWPTPDPSADQRPAPDPANDDPALRPEPGPAEPWPTTDPAADQRPTADPANDGPASTGWPTPADDPRLAPAADQRPTADPADDELTFRPGSGPAEPWPATHPAAEPRPKHAARRRSEPAPEPEWPALGEADGAPWNGGDATRPQPGDQHVPPRRTRSGLPVRRPTGTRRPAPAGTGDAVQARVRAQDDLLVALRGRPVPRPEQTTVPAGNGATAQTSGGLARRVPGAQLPDTTGPRLRRGPAKGGPAQPSPPATEQAGGDGDREQQLHDLLRHFTEGRNDAHGDRQGDA